MFVSTNNKQLLILYSNDELRTASHSLSEWRIKNSFSAIQFVTISVFEWRITNSSLFVIWMANNKQLFICNRRAKNKQILIRYSTCDYFSALITKNKQLFIGFSEWRITNSSLVVFKLVMISVFNRRITNNSLFVIRLTNNKLLLFLCSNGE